MEVRIYEANMNFVGLVENQTSVLWNRAYFGGGSFELYCPITANNRNILQMGRLVWLRGAVDAGVIESLTMEQNAVRNQITAKGRFLDSYMTRRLIRPFYSINNGLVETAMRQILSNAATIPLVQLGPAQGFQAHIVLAVDVPEPRVQAHGHAHHLAADHQCQQGSGG